MSISSDKISFLKQVVQNHVNQSNVQSEIHNILSAQGNLEENLSEENLYSTLLDKGVIDNLISQLQFDAPHIADSNFQEIGNVDPSRRYLHMQIQGGKAFLDHLQRVDGTSSAGGVITYTLHIYFRGQRFCSSPTPCACEPNFNESFLLELVNSKSSEKSRIADSVSLLSMKDSIHCVLVETEASGESALVASTFLEWRLVLNNQNSTAVVNLELKGIGAESRVTVGVIMIKLDLIPKLANPVSEKVLSAQIALEKNRQAEQERLFLVYSRQWWKEYLEIRQEHSQRYVKIFALDEMNQSHPVCSYVQPLRADRFLDSARDASRFVNLLGYEKVVSVGGGNEKAERWSHMHAFLASKRGDCEDHCVLLCSLLLGFGLNAFVCIGTKNRNTSHSWVMTLNENGQATFWESLTGNRYSHQCIDPDDTPFMKQKSVSYPYQTIGCVFNHCQFYANCQPVDKVECCDFQLNNQAKWKSMASDVIESICSQYPKLPPLTPSVIDTSVVSNELEIQLRSLITEHRKDQGLSSLWDDNLSYLLSPALAAYEVERQIGVSAGNEEFQQAIRRAVPEGQTFKGYPIQFAFRNARRIFTKSLKHSVCHDIVNCRGDSVKLAVRVKVISYPDSVCSTWIMFACKYKSIL